MNTTLRPRRHSDVFWFVLFVAVVLAASLAVYRVEPGPVLAGQAPTPSLRSLFLPGVARPCPLTGATYAAGPARQWDLDNPVRPAASHADKNIDLRYLYYTWPPPRLVDRGWGSPEDLTQPPQLATLFEPHAVPAFVNAYSVGWWYWRPSPDPGYPGGPFGPWPTTVLGVFVPEGQTLHVPLSGYDIGGGYEVIVIFADEDSIALKYTREDSAATGYLVHVDNICTDPHLLDLYEQLDAAGGPRYVYMGGQSGDYWYDLPVLAAGQAFGTSRGYYEIRIALRDTGSFMDPQSCQEWWQIRPGVEC